MRPVVADIALRAPVFRHLLGWVGAIGASKPSMSRALQEGNSLMLIPGGVAEMFYSTPGKETILLRGRKGFVRLALETGTDLVPVYCFGNTRTLTLAPFIRLFETLARRLQFALVMFYGRWGLPVPHKVPLLYAVGARIPVVRLAKEHITPEVVDALHDRFVAAMAALYDKYAVTYAGDATAAVLTIL